MTQPLALVLYEKLMPGSQLVNRLHDLSYRVQAISDPNQLASAAQTEKPMLIFADLQSSHAEVCTVLADVRRNPESVHIPIVAFADESAAPLQAAARQAGATVVVSNTALLAHLPQLLEQALRIE